MSNQHTGSDLTQERLNGSLIDAADGHPQDALDLLEAGADPNGYPLIMAIQCSSPSIVQAMLSHGADPNAPYLETTPLIHAVRCCDLEIVSLLLAAGADPNGEDSQGATPIQIVPSRKGTSPAQISAVRGALIDAGAR